MVRALLTRSLIGLICDGRSRALLHVRRRLKSNYDALGRSCDVIEPGRVKRQSGGLGENERGANKCKGRSGLKRCDQ
jgi:hypothetical protein